MSNGSKGHIVRIRNFDLSGSYLEAAVPDSDQIGKFRHTTDPEKITPSSRERPLRDSHW